MANSISEPPVILLVLLIIAGDLAIPYTGMISEIIKTIKNWGERMEIPEKLSSELKNVSGLKIRRNEPLASHTTMEVGGPADLFLQPMKSQAMTAVIDKLNSYQFPYFLLGGGSNVIAADRGIRGAVISTRKLQQIKIQGELATVEAGVLLSDFCQELAEAGLSGLEFASGIPGTLGGAIYMNAGAYGGEIKDCLQSAEVLTAEGWSQTLTAEELELEYRSSLLQQQNLIALSASFKLRKRPSSEIKAEIQGLKARRWASQPMDQPSAGSTFKRPPGHYAGSLIEESGLKGYRIGGAMVSSKHAGFIVNTGGATARDIIELMLEIKEKVYQKFGVRLKPEPRLIGEFDKLPY